MPTSYPTERSEQYILNKVFDPNTNTLNTGASITPGADFQIGAVELKNRDTDDRAYVDPSGNQYQVQSSRLDNVNDAVLAHVFGHAYTVISTAATTTVKSGSGVVRQIRVLGGTLGNVTVYDNTAGSGTLIVPTVTPAGPTILAEDVGFSTGLTIVTAAATLILVTWR